VQVDPITPTLKAPETRRLKVKSVGSLSNFAFNLNLRCYIEEGEGKDAAAEEAPAAEEVEEPEAGRCMLNLSNPR
jgi:hypothetical protein